MNLRANKKIPLSSPGSRGIRFTQKKLSSLAFSDRLKWLTGFVLIVVSSGAWSEDIEARLNWDKKVKLSTPVSGVVGQVVAKTGDKVKKGDTLLSLDDRVLKADLEFANTHLKYMERLNKEAKQELERNLELYERTVLSNHELEAAHLAYEKILSGLMQAKKQQAQAEFNMNYSVVKAPFDGVVIKQHATEGQTVISNQQAKTLVELAAIDAMVAEFSVTGGVLRKLVMGKKVSIRIGKRKLKGRIAAIAYEPYPKSNRYAVKARFETRGKFYRTGRSVKVVLP